MSRSKCQDPNVLGITEGTAPPKQAHRNAGKAQSSRHRQSPATPATPAAVPRWSSSNVRAGGTGSGEHATTAAHGITIRILATRCSLCRAGNTGADDSVNVILEVAICSTRRAPLAQPASTSMSGRACSGLQRSATSISTAWSYFQSFLLLFHCCQCVSGL